MSSYVENSQTRHGCSVTILTVLSGASYLMVLILTNCQINGIVRIIQIPTWDHVIFLKRRKRKLNSHMLKHKRNACEYFFQCIFLGGKGGRRPVASLEFFGFENISFLNCIQSQSSIKLSRFQNAQLWGLFLVGIYYYGAQAAAFLSDACQPEVSLFLVQYVLLLPNLYC